MALYEEEEGNILGQQEGSCSLCQGETAVAEGCAEVRRVQTRVHTRAHAHNCDLEARVVQLKTYPIAMLPTNPHSSPILVPPQIAQALGVLLHTCMQL